MIKILLVSVMMFVGIGCEFKQEGNKYVKEYENELEEHDVRCNGAGDVITIHKLNQMLEMLKRLEKHHYGESD